MPLAEVADLKRDSVTNETAELLAALPPRPFASEKSEATTTEVANVLATEPAGAADASDERSHQAAADQVATVLAASPPGRRRRRQQAANQPPPSAGAWQPMACQQAAAQGAHGATERRRLFEQSIGRACPA